jgi:hypothetical protein
MITLKLVNLFFSTDKNYKLKMSMTCHYLLCAISKSYCYGKSMVTMLVNGCYGRSMVAMESQCLLRKSLVVMGRQ